jgi:hypothetical protein
METRRDVLVGLGGAGAGVVAWAVGSTVAAELRASEVRHVVLRNETERTESLDVLFERDGEVVGWNTYELEPEQAVEPDAPDRAGEYRVHVRWDGLTRTRRLDAGERAVAVVLALPFGDEEILIRDVPSSSLDSTASAAGASARSSAEPTHH